MTTSYFIIEDFLQDIGVSDKGVTSKIYKHRTTLDEDTELEASLRIVNYPDKDSDIQLDINIVVDDKEVEDTFPIYVSKDMDETVYRISSVLDNLKFPRVDRMPIIFLAEEAVKELRKGSVEDQSKSSGVSIENALESRRIYINTDGETTRPFSMTRSVIYLVNDLEEKLNKGLDNVHVGDCLYLSNIERDANGEIQKGWVKNGEWFLIRNKDGILDIYDSVYKRIDKDKYEDRWGDVPSSKVNSYEESFEHEIEVAIPPEVWGKDYGSVISATDATLHEFLDQLIEARKKPLADNT